MLIVVSTVLPMGRDMVFLFVVLLPPMVTSSVAVGPPHAYLLSNTMHMLQCPHMRPVRL